MKAKGSILVVDDEEIVRESLASWLEEEGYQVDTAPDGPTALTELAQHAYAVLLIDLKMPGMDGLEVLGQARSLQPDVPMIIMTAHATVDTAVQAMKQGAHDYLVKPFEPEDLSVMVNKLNTPRTRRRENVLLHTAPTRQFEFQDLVSKSPRMEAVFDLARTAAKSDSTVLIFGESGTGKELLARAIHAESPRREGGFVGVSCAASTESLLESELFGHETGALTGAVASICGKLEIATGGTLFLDEIGDISQKLQLDLLRVLDTREFRRVGGPRLIKTDVRIVATTNRDLKQLVESGAFREDLYYRLNVIPMTLPALRERKEDIPLLVEHCLAQFRSDMRKPLQGISAEALEVLMAHDWPGNIRELRNILERAAVMAQAPIITPLDLELIAPASPGGPPATDLSESLRDVERKHIAAMLKQQHWNITRSARSLGIDRMTLYNKIKRYHIREDE